VESMENDGAVFHSSPNPWKSLRECGRTIKIKPSDFHIPSAPAASMSGIQNPRGQNPLRLPFASFRLIFGLEKTTTARTWVSMDERTPATEFAKRPAVQNHSSHPG
jgi:hypothetical protein